ncbi:MAG: sulfotransferase domain-containing protein [Actinomycetia bacterium]|nr:sulfotransferase domain-containing protein [Actinomycetes bacterium]
MTTDPPVPVLFIGGIGRSGSTVFELSLGTDARVVSLGEVIHLWDRSLIDDESCGCGEPFSRCDFWQQLGEQAFGGWSHIDAQHVHGLRRRIDRTVRTPQLALGVGPAGWLDDVREYASYYERLYRAALEVSGRELVVDSSKQASMPYVLRHAPGVDLKVMHCLRDSRAVAYSWTKRVQRPEARTDEARFMTQYSPGLLGLKWMQHNAVIEGLRLRGVPTMRLRYEDWAEEPVAALEEALEFAGLETRRNEAVTRDWVDLPVSHTCSGNPMRFRTGRVRIRRDEAWTKTFPRRSRLLVTGLTGPALAAYGYLRRQR